VIPHGRCAGDFDLAVLLAVPEWDSQRLPLSGRIDEHVGQRGHSLPLPFLRVRPRCPARRADAGAYRAASRRKRVMMVV